MEPGDIFWASLPLLKRSGNQDHPAVCHKTLDDGILIFGGTSTPDDSLDLLHVVDFSNSLYRPLRRHRMAKPTYFYWEFFQVIAVARIRSKALFALDPEDYQTLRQKSNLR